MKVVFFGTAPFGLPTLDAIARSSRHALIGVVTGPDKPQGRGRHLAPTAVAQWALDAGVDSILKPDDLNSESLIDNLNSLSADAFCVVAFRILPTALLDIPKTAFNLHASLLPAYRGAAPIQRAIMAGETVTGVTTFLLKKTIDTGDILLQRSIDIGANETAGELFDRLSALGAEVVVDTLNALEDGTADPKKQDDARASKAPKLGPNDRCLDFDHPTEQVLNHIRAMSPRPGVMVRWNDYTLRVVHATPEDMTNVSFTAGSVISADPKTGMVVATADGAVRLEKIQPEGKKVLSGSEFVRGYHIRVDERLEPIFVS